MEPETFNTKYELALATQQWVNVEPLIHQNACVTFSSGSVHKGIDAIKAAYERNFSLIKSEQYSISNIHWIVRDKNYAVYLFDFSWKGMINGQEAGGSGRGTTTLINENGEWKLIAEHLGHA